MAGDLVLALDQGTTSTRAVLFDAQANPVAQAALPVRQHYPRPGWVEHSPKELWLTALECMRRALREAKVEPSRLAAVGVTNQRETTVAWDRRTGKPVHNAIVWQDRRTAPRCQQLKKRGAEKEVRAKTGLVVDAYFSATKMEWLLRHAPGAKERAARGDLLLGTVDSWLLWNLTAGLEDSREAVHATDASNASRTMLYDLRRGRWDPGLLDEFGIPREALPEVRNSSGDLGRVHRSVLGREVPIGGVAGDQQAALFGQACFRPGEAKNTYGTGCFALMNAGREAPRPRHGLVGTVAWRIGGRTTYALEGSVFIAGAAIQWLRDLGLFADSRDTDALARSVPDNLGVVFVPAFVGLGSPYWDPTARGAFFGLTRGAGKAHLVRAALESIAFQSRDALEAMRTATGKRVGSLKVDGGAAANDYLLQFQADVLRAKVVRPRVLETTSLGAAFLAGLGAGVWPSLRDLAATWRAERTFAPGMQPRQRAAHLAAWRKAVQRARGWT